MIGGLFEMKFWGDWAVRSVLVTGALAIGFFCVMQYYGHEGMEVEINWPTIQHTFKK